MMLVALVVVWLALLVTFIIQAGSGDSGTVWFFGSWVVLLFIAVASEAHDVVERRRAAKAGA